MVPPLPHNAHVTQVATGALAAPQAGSPSLLTDPAVRMERATNETRVMSATVASAGDASFNLTFSLDRPGYLNFIVMYKSMAARYMNAYVAFDNPGPADPADAISSSMASFSSGVVARGSCGPAGGGAVVSCVVGPRAPGDPPNAYTCIPDSVTCSVENACFGSLCDYSRQGVVSDTAYKVGVGVDDGPSPQHGM